MYNSKNFVEEAIHVKFNDNKPNNKMSELDESFAKMKIEDIIKFVVASGQNQTAPNPPMENHPEKVKEPIRGLLRKHHPKS